MSWLNVRNEDQSPLIGFATVVTTDPEQLEWERERMRRREEARRAERERLDAERREQLRKLTPKRVLTTGEWLDRHPAPATAIPLRIANVSAAGTWPAVREDGLEVRLPVEQVPWPAAYTVSVIWLAGGWAGGGLPATGAPFIPSASADQVKTWLSLVAEAFSAGRPWDRSLASALAYVRATTGDRL